MNVLIIGSGGREHALALKIKESNRLNKLFVAPGNAGTGEIAENVKLNPAEQSAVVSFCLKNKIDLVVIGPEKPLADGLADKLRENGILVFGPQQRAAQIESDKAFAKDLMKKYKIPTATYKTFKKSDYAKAITYASTIGYPVVVKASGLAAGKGVTICESPDEAESAIKDCFENQKFGEAGNEIVIEEFLKGDEFSVFAITDGTKYITLPPAQDHKRIGEGDTGKNTGGMGAYAPTPFISDEIMRFVKTDIIDKTLEAMKMEGREYSGCLYCGLILTDAGPKVIEFNCRFGDPETQVVLPLLEGDFLELLYSVAKGNLNEDVIKYNGAAAVCIVAASAGYPDKYGKGFEIFGLSDINETDIQIIHAGTRKENGKIITNGGRVLNVIAIDKKGDLTECIKKAYSVLPKVKYEGIYYRKDIGDKVL